MDSKPTNYGRTSLAAIELLEPAVFDLLDDRASQPSLGKTETPTNVLPAWAIDMNDPATSPALVLTFQVRPGVNPSAVTFDLFAAYALLDRYEISLGGGGLAPNETESDITTSNRVVRLVLSATEQAGAASRLARLADVVNGANQAIRWGAIADRSFERSEAEIRIAA
jgi:hypothetical protein